MRDLDSITEKWVWKAFQKYVQLSDFSPFFSVIPPANIGVFFKRFWSGLGSVSSNSMYAQKSSVK